MSASLNHRELKQCITRAIGEFRPEAICQILQMDLGINMPTFRQFIREIINESCQEFLMHARKWTPNPEYRALEVMSEYHML